MREVVYIEGDGIGPEVVGAAIRAVDATGAKIKWTRALAGSEAEKAGMEPLPQDTLDMIKAVGIALKGPTETPIGKGRRSVNVALRRELDLYANLRRTRTVVGVDTPFKDIDITVVRENTEGIYSGIEHEVTPGVVTSLRVVTEKASRRIAEYAFALAAKEPGRRAHVKDKDGNPLKRKVTALHKANIIKLGDGLFLRCCKEVAKKYEGVIQYEEMIIDNACMQLVRKPRQFDVLVMENFNGDLISDLCAGLVGGTGVCPGSNYGTESAVFEAIHGSAPDIAGKRLANPAAVMLSAAEMLEHMGGDYVSCGRRLEKAIFDVIATRDATKLTRDLGGETGTDGFTTAVVLALTT